MEDFYDNEKGVDTAELWVERLRVAAAEHYSRHVVPNLLEQQAKTAEYVRHTIMSNRGNVNNGDIVKAKDLDGGSDGTEVEPHRPTLTKIDPVVKIHAEEMSEDDTALILEKGRLGVKRMGQQLGPLAGWLKDEVDQELGPDWQVIVGKRGSFGSCLSPLAGHYINFSMDDITFLIFRAN